MPRQFYKEDGELIPAIQFVLTQPVGYTLITDSAEIKFLYLGQYRQRIEDGHSYVLNFTADKYIEVLNGIYTEPEVFALESHIKDLYQELNNGWWLTAQNTNTNLALNGIYDQTMKDSIQVVLDSYIAQNY